MLALISTLLSWLACRFRSRAELELELIALRHQVAVLNRQRRSRPRLYSVDRLLGVWFYPGVAALPPDHGSNGTQSDLEPVKLRNQVEVDPAKDDFFRAVIEQRKALPNLKSISAEAKERLDLFLKILANAGSYGIYTRLDRIDLPEKDAEILTVYGLDGTFSAPTNVVERPGESYFPPLAAQITAGARLMLALLERLVAAAGGSYVFCDTDSMAITLPLEEVKQIAKRFVSLVPYNRSIVPGSILKIEDENLDPETGRPLQLFCHAIAWG